MARSRSPRWFFTRRGWIICGVIAFAGLLVYLHAELRSIQRPVWQAEQQAEKQAREQGGLVEVASAEKYVWDEPLWIANGRDAEGKEQYVWLFAKAPVHKEEAAGSASKTSISNAVQQRHPGADIIRVRPGWYQGKPVWEARYSLQADQKRYYYEFYQFVNGAYITTFSLSAKRSS